jgi:hypothetical protein
VMMGMGSVPATEDWARTKEILTVLGSPAATIEAHAKLEELAKTAHAAHAAATTEKASAVRDRAAADEHIRLKLIEADQAIAAKWRAHDADAAARNLDGREAALAAREKEIEARKTALAASEAAVAAKWAKLTEAARVVATT